MKLELKIVIGYFLLVLLLAGADWLLPHGDLSVVGLVNVSLQMLLAALSFLIMKHTEDPAQRKIFFYSMLYFGSGLLLLLSSFAGYLFLQRDPYGPFLYHLYVNKVLLALMSGLAILSIAVDFALHRMSALQKSLLTIVLASALVATLFSGFILHPYALYKEYDYVLLQGMKDIEGALASGQQAPALSDADLAAAVRSKAPAGSELSPEGSQGRDMLADIGRLRPYLQPGGETTIFWRPLDLAVIYVHVVLLGIITFLLIQFYRVNANLGAYVDKILILFFLFFSLEVFHAAGFLVTPNEEDHRVIYGLGQYVTIFCLLLMVYAYDLKLRFALSVAGKYYEFAVGRSPENVTRWRDELDRMILRAFLKRNHGYDRLGIFSQSNTTPD